MFLCCFYSKTWLIRCLIFFYLTKKWVSCLVVSPLKIPQVSNLLHTTLVQDKKPLAPSVLKYHNWSCNPPVDTLNWEAACCWQGKALSVNQRVNMEVWGKDSDKPAESRRGEREENTAFLLCRFLSHCLCELFVEGLLCPFAVFCCRCLFQHLCFKELNTPALCSPNPPCDSLTGPRWPLRSLVFVRQRAPPFWMWTAENILRHLKRDVSWPWD